MNWTIVIGPIQDALGLADIITDLIDEYDFEYSESPNRTGLNPTYSLLFGKFEDRRDAEQIAAEIHERLGLNTTITILTAERNVLPPDLFDPRAFIDDIYGRYSDGVATPGLCLIVNAMIEENPKDADEIRRMFFSKFKDVETIFAIPYGIEYIRNVEDIQFLKVLLTRMQRNQMEHEAIDLILHRHGTNGDAEYRKIVLPLLFAHRSQLIFGDGEESAEVIACRIKEILQTPEIDASELYETMFVGLRGRNEHKTLRIDIAKRFGHMWSGGSDVECELAMIAFQSGKFKDPISKLEKHGGTTRWKAQLERIRSHERLLRDGWGFPPAAPPNPLKVLGLVRYLAYTSVPHHVSGYATRTHNLLLSLNNIGRNVECVTRYSYPWVDLKLDSDSVDMLDVIDGIQYHRQPNDGDYLKSTIEQRLQTAIDSLVTHCEKEGVPEILHAASNWMNGIVAVHAGRILGVPVIYEVRGLWELTRTAKDPDFEGSEHFQMISRMEVEAARAADCVITITEGLRQELISRGVPADRIRLAQNGVDTERFKPLERDMDLARELGLPEGPVVGYVGSLVRYEGIHHLLEAVSKLRQENRWKGSVMIVGDGEVRSELEALSKSLGIADICIFTGRVDFREVERYYSLIDIAPFPRLPLKVCELVSPLKPFEAMAMGIPVIASDVAAMEEFITPNENGILFRKGDCDSLAEALHQMITDASLLEELGASSRSWVKNNRTWIHSAETIASIHDDLRVARRPTILIAGHDLKFIYEMGREFIRRGYTVLEDNWANHTGHDVELSKRLIKVADLVICEWALGNARWYSNHIQAHQKLFFRLHLQEVDTEHLDEVDWTRVDKVVFIAPHVRRKAIERFGIPENQTTLIPNFVDTRRFDVLKTPSSNTTIGFMGIVPRRKRFDHALTVLEGVRAKRPEFELSTKGKRPEEYAWMLKRTAEMAWYQRQYGRIEQSNLLRGAIRYQGWTSSPYSWFEEIGFLLSVSDFEGSHQAVAEGAASGAIPIILRWEGADEVYPPSWCVDTLEEGIERILNFNETLSFEERELERMNVANHIRDHFDLKIIVERWLEMMDPHQSR